MDRIKQYWLLARFDRPIGILILLWPALWALWVASDGRPDLAGVNRYLPGRGTDACRRLCD